MGTNRAKPLRAYVGSSIESEKYFSVMGSNPRGRMTQNVEPLAKAFVLLTLRIDKNCGKTLCHTSAKALNTPNTIDVVLYVVFRSKSELFIWESQA